jgi:hypothetical protein
MLISYAETIGGANFYSMVVILRPDGCGDKQAD